MNNRDYKEFAPGVIMHIFNRGNNRENIFFEEQDYKAFLFRLGLVLGFEETELQKESLISLPHSRVRITDVNKNDFKLYAFCLMPNHFHLLIEQRKDTPISKIISKLCTSYAKYINQKYKKVGHVFQDKFKSVEIENNPQLMWSSAYIHMNPVKDRLTRHPSQYKWSSFNDYVDERNLPITDTKLLKSILGTAEFKQETLNYLKDDVMSKTVFDM